ncbi:hypothetical protein QYE76_047927 [Lolium multiflorum]|uniref:Reverse transcriptase/retrotransposon-derived protein RNase H-like domain-containing protein n=1 Tax=Lolium multiflorum TaxID=4521 RepID=A0AAD8X0M5_LOLMU|nr:hypothetical protein QYE76_047927 [Lolium multiflorum]
MGPVLQMPDFDMPFVVDCDASGIGFCVVLHQGEGPLALFSRPFTDRHHKLAAYERELIRLVQARCATGDLTFGVAPVDQKALRLRLHRRVPPRRLDTVTDALSHRDTEDVTDDVATTGTVLCIRSEPSFAFIDDIRRATSTAPDAQALCRRLDAGELGAPWRLDDGRLLHGRAFSCPPMVTCATRSCPWGTLQDTRACQRPSIACVPISTSPVMACWSVAGCGHA